ncbi:MAG: (2Fe-2S)-binding protein [Pseudonocardiaceae bacterium]
MSWPKPVAGPLELTQRRLRTVRPDYPHLYAVEVGVPAGDGWVGLAGAIADGTITNWYTAALRRESAAGLASVAAVGVVSMLAHAVLGRLTATLVLDRRTHGVSAENLAVHLDEDGYVDQVAACSPTVCVLPDDKAADDPHAVVRPDLTVLLDETATQAVATLTPVIDQVSAASRFGIVPAWNVVADSVLSTAMLVPLYLGGDELAGRAIGVALLDALVAHGARIRTRGTCQTVTREPDMYRLPVRGSCCFFYKTGPDVDQPGDEYCTTCPLLDDTTRTRRFRALLDGYVPPRRCAVATETLPQPVLG